MQHTHEITLNAFGYASLAEVKFRGGLPGFLAWAVPHKRSRVMCSEACAEMLGLGDAWRFDPCVLRAAVGAKP